jgi:hypothetical protein
MQAKKNGLIGAAAVFASLSLFGGLSVNAEADVPPWSDAPENGLAETSSSVPTNLWCTWYVNGMDANVNLYPIDGLLKTDVIAEKVLTEYDGDALLLTGYALESEALVAGYLGDAPEVSDRKTDNVLNSPDPYDCSWYNAEQGFESNVSVVSADDEGNQTFVATVNGEPDTGMDFGLTSALGDGITITYSQEPGSNCDGAFLLEDGATIESGSSTAKVLSVVYSATLGTTLTCQWDTMFQITMPAGKTPASPGDDYSFTGPTIKTTVTLDPAPPAE